MFILLRRFIAKIYIWKAETFHGVNLVFQLFESSFISMTR